MNLHLSKKQIFNAGFTLVEMIVVLVILGILASAAVYGIAAYIDFTRYNSNQKNAESIYQSVQATLNHMSENGTIDKWVQDLIGTKGMTGEGADGYGDPNGYQYENSDIYDNIFNESFFLNFPLKDSEALPGQSAHMRYVATYTPKSDDPQSKFVFDLIRNDFQSTDIINGLITIEFDVEKALDSDGNIHLNANVYSVFFDSKRTEWDSVAYKLDNSIVPFREEEYRRSTSLIGYICGKQGVAAVDSVYLPSDVEFNTFTLRNGETLDLTWSMKSEDGNPITGNPAHIHYTFELYDPDNEDKKFCDLVVNENSILEGIPSESLYTRGFSDYLKFTIDSFVNGKTTRNESDPFIGHNGSEAFTIVYTQESVSDRRGFPMIVYRASIHTTAKVYVHKVTNSSYDFNYNDEGSNLLNQNNYYDFPLTISYEIYVAEKDPTKKPIREGISYTLSLDAMMARNVIEYASSNSANIDTLRTMNYSIGRLLNTGNKLLNDKLPRNFHVKMYAQGDDELFENYGENPLPQTERIDATRALDDPIYYQSPHVYRYILNAVSRPGIGTEDATGYAIVNSYFGDLTFKSSYKISHNSSDPFVYGSFGSKIPVGTDADAVINCYRHLYNIRLLEKTNVSVCYSIARDLNWYYKKNEVSDKPYSSDVMVYSLSPDPNIPGNNILKGFSPIAIPDPSTNKYYGNELSVVSFPSIPTLNKNSTLVACQTDTESSDDTTAIINNLQMRMLSFYNGKDKNGNDSGLANTLFGYGIINVNYGTVINIRANGLSLVLCNKPDGSPDDSGEIKEGIQALVNTVIDIDPDSFEGTSPVGAIIGTNGGTVGDRTVTDSKLNTIKVNNCIVTTLHKNGSEWKLYKTSAISCIIGDHGASKPVELEGHAYGVLETTGHFVAAGYINAGGVIGYSKSDIDAIIRVDNSLDENSPCKPLIDFGSSNHGPISSVIYATTEAVGGAVGKMDKGRHFCQNAGSDPLSTSTPNDGRFELYETLVSSNPLDSKPGYAINVTLDQGSYIVFKTDQTPKNKNIHGGIGGAVGYMYYSGKLSIRVENSGYIVASEGKTYTQNLGGAIGTIAGTSNNSEYSIISDMDIFVINKGNLGTYDGDNTYGYSNSTGGAIGRIERIRLSEEDVTITLSVNNEGSICGNYSHLSANNAGYNGVGGAIGSVYTDSYSHLPIFTIKCINSGKIIGDTPVNQGDSHSNTYGVGGAIGYTKYFPSGSAIYSVLKSGASVHSLGNNAGGAIGAQSTNPTSESDSSPTTITVDLNNATISAEYANAGGAIGNIGHFYWKTEIRAKVTGTVHISAWSDAGGVCGRLNTSTSTIYSSIVLEGDTNSVLSIKALGTPDSTYKDNAGGLIGLCTVSGGTADFNPELKLPSQTGNDILAFTVDSYNNAGGMIGMFKNSSQRISTAMTVTLHPSCHVHTSNDNAGGCIGKLDSNKAFSSDMLVQNASIALTVAPYISADGNNAGGCIGYCTDSTNNNSVFLTLNEGYSLSVNSTKGITVTGGLYDTDTNTFSGGNAGGCIGYLEKSAIINGSVNISGNNITVAGFNNTGGAIGKCSNIKINETGSVSVGTLTADPLPAPIESIMISGRINTGGVIGHCSKPTVSGSVAFRMVRGELAESIIGIENTGGCIGKLNSGTVQNTAVIEFTGKYYGISGNNYTGGCIGITLKDTGDNNGTNIYGKVEFGGSNNKVAGTAEYTGGVIGGINQCSVSESSSITYSSNISVISGIDYTGGVIGRTYQGSYTGNSTIGFTAEQSSINGNNFIGGIIGGTYQGSFNGKSRFGFTAKQSSITGNNYIGGIIGGTYQGSFNGDSSFDFNAQQTSINGKDYTGGVIGRMDQSTFTERVKIIFNAQKSSVSGNACTGGVIGGTERGSFKGESSSNTMNIIFNGTDSNISGSADYTGGVIGQTKGTKFDVYTSVTYSGVASGNSSTINISGKNYTGGLIGGMIPYTSGSSTTRSNLVENSLFTFSGKSSLINGDNNVGGLIGASENCTIYARLTCSPTSSCKIIGKDNVGGCVGSASSGDHNMYGPTTISVNGNCSFEITGTGYTGGIIGKLYNGSWYKSSEINLTGNVTLSIKSTGSSAGGHVGYMQGVNFGSSVLNTSLQGNSSMSVNGFKAAGGIVGYIENENKNNTPTINFNMTGNNTHLDIRAGGEGCGEAGAGGIVGINGSNFGKTNDVSFTGNHGSINIYANETGSDPANVVYLGSYMGINNRTYKGNPSADYLSRINPGSLNVVGK